MNLNIIKVNILNTYPKLPYKKKIFNFLLFIYCAVLTFFIWKTIYSSRYSDYKEHIKFTLPGGENYNCYSLLHKIMIFFSDISAYLNMNRYQFNALIMLVTVIIAFLSTIIIINNYFKKTYKNINFYFIDISTFALITVSMIYIFNPFTNSLIRGYTGNPWYSPTYIFCKPFSLMVLLLIFKIYEQFKEKTNYRNLLFALSFFSTLSMWAKPSFLMSFLPAIAIILIYKYFNKEISIHFLIVIGLALLPSLLPFLIIKNNIYHSNNATSQVIVTFGKSWYNITNSIWLSIFVSAAFPLYVFFLNLKNLSFAFKLIFLNFVIAILTNFFLAESGNRLNHQNFGWGVMYGLFFMFIISFETFFFIKKHPKKYNNFGIFLFLFHLFSGLAYFTKAFIRII